jgi:hypothetical protein
MIKVLLIALCLTMISGNKLTFLEEKLLDAFIEQQFEGLNGKGDVSVNLNCDATSTFRNTVAHFTPAVVKTSSPVEVTARGYSTKDEVILALQINLNWKGKTLYTKTVPINKTIAANEELEYGDDEKIPFFIPAGHYDIIGKLVNDKGVAVSCMKISFNW